LSFSFSDDFKCCSSWIRWTTRCACLDIISFCSSICFCSIRSLGQNSMHSICVIEWKTTNTTLSEQFENPIAKSKKEENRI
jgi:hypothetical protein